MIGLIFERSDFDIVYIGFSSLQGVVLMVHIDSGFGDDEVNRGPISPVDSGFGRDFKHVGKVSESPLDKGFSGMSGLSTSVGNIPEDLYNPLLDDEDDEGDFSDVDDESAPFLGFDNVSDDGLLSELLEDDELDSAGSVSGLGSFREVLGEKELVPDADKRRLDEVSGAWQAARKAEVASRPAAVVPEGKGSRAVSSEFKRHDTREVVVPVDGVVGGRSERGVAPKQGSKERYRYVRENGRLNGAELDFYKNLGVSKAGLARVPSRVAMLRGKVGENESEGERKVRSLLYGQAVGGADALKRGSKLRFSEKDRQTLAFLAMFRYAPDHQLARIFSQSRVTMYNRLKRLRTQGLVIDKKMYGIRPIWFLTEAGMLLSGFDLPRVTESKMSFSMFPHQFTVNNTAGNLWGANVNVLNLPDYPERNRSDGRGGFSFGESLVSELEIQSSLGRMKKFETGDVFNPILRAQIEREFDEWLAAGGVEFGESPEFQFGNEYMWALLPPYNIKLAYHVPDLVVARPRSADGSPNSIAVEVEINNKSSRAYEKTLRAYKSDDKIFKEVVWVCKNIGPARKLESIAKEIGLWQEGRLRIVPVLTEDGVFKEKDLWTI